MMMNNKPISKVNFEKKLDLHNIENLALLNPHNVIIQAKYLNVYFLI
jgi:hypothetical protein